LIFNKYHPHLSPLPSRERRYLKLSALNYLTGWFFLKAGCRHWVYFFEVQ